MRTANVVKVYPKSDELKKIVQSLRLAEKILTDLQNVERYNANEDQLQIAADLVKGNIEHIKSLYESKA